MKRKPVPMKPVKAWAVVNRRGLICQAYLDGYFDIGSRKKELAVFDDERLVRVEIREVRRKKK